MFVKKAFTLVEIITALTIVGVISAITLSTGINMEKIRLAKTKALSNSFYALVNAAYPDILKNNAVKSGNYMYLCPSTYTECNTTELASKKLRDLFIPYLDAREATDDEVSNLKTLIGTSYAASSFNSVFSTDTCLRTPQKITACFHMKTQCTLSGVDLFYTCSDDAVTHKDRDNVCGSIFYITPDSKGTVYEDIFSIPLGKSGVKG